MDSLMINKTVISIVRLPAHIAFIALLSTVYSLMI